MSNTPAQTPPRPQDQVLQDDVRRLGAMLGRAIDALSGPAAFEDVERLRQLCLDRRRGVATAQDAVALVRSWDLPRAEAVVRAFSLYFRLVNTAEQTHRVRRRRHHRRAGAADQRGSLAYTVNRLHEQGIAPDELAHAFRRVIDRSVTWSRRCPITSRCSSQRASRSVS